MQKILLAVLGSAALLMAGASANAASLRVDAGDGSVVRVHGGDGGRHHHRWNRRHHDDDRWEGRHHRRHWRHGGWRHRDRDAGVRIIIGRDRGHRGHHRDRDDDIEFSK